MDVRISSPLVAALAVLLGTVPAYADVPADGPPTADAAPPAVAEPTVVEPPAEVAAPPPIVLAPDISRVTGALVEWDTAWTSGSGLLLGDARTVVFPAPSSDAGRTITVHTLAHPGVEVDAADVAWTAPWSPDQPFFVATLERPLDAQPLAVSGRAPALGQHVFVLDTANDDESPARFELIETTITSVSDSRFALGLGGASTTPGSPVLDADGAVVGVLGWDGSAIRAERLLDREQYQPRGMSLLPVLGLRGFYEWGGVSDGTGGAMFDFGLALWDQLALVVNFGVNGGRGSYVRRLAKPADGSRGAGQLRVSDLGIDAGLEIQYRLLIARWTVPLYLRLAAGVRYSYVGADPQGVAIYAADPACDPFTAGNTCALVSGPMPGGLDHHGVGLIVGADVTLGSFSVGYRYVPAAVAYNIPDMHMLLFGFSIF